jgi:hypothetical protein
MNEFIVWDKMTNNFVDLKEFENQVFIDCNGQINWFSFEGMSNKCITLDSFQYIGKKDINDKKIYADCSIVEFERENIGYRGYFTFDKDMLFYKIKLLPERRGGIISFKYNPFEIENLKIIDTIQENKLGLKDNK